MKLSIPNRQANEEDLSPAQYTYIRSLLNQLNIPKDSIEYECIGTLQASSLLDQLIPLKEASGLGTVSISINKNERPSFLLALGIFFMPYLFSWTTLHPRYSITTKVISIGWAVILIYLMCN